MYEPAFRLKHEVLPGSYGQLSFEVDPAGAKRLLDQLGEEPLASQKNCSPITVEECLDLKAMIKSLTGNSARPSGPSFREHILWLSCLYRFAVRPACSKRMLFLFLLSLASWQDRVFHGDERQ
jgi:hypothetical protein